MPSQLYAPELNEAHKNGCNSVNVFLLTQNFNLGLYIFVKTQFGRLTIQEALERVPSLLKVVGGLLQGMDEVREQQMSLALERSVWKSEK